MRLDQFLFLFLSTGNALLIKSIIVKILFILSFLKNLSTFIIILYQGGLNQKEEAELNLCSIFSILTFNEFYSFV